MSPVEIVLVYQSLLGIYGDRGNAMVLRQRLAWRGIDAVLTEVEHLTKRLDNRLGKPTEEAIQLSWALVPLIAKGATVQRNDLERLSEAAQEQLSEIDALLQEERGRLADVLGAKKDHERLAAEQEIMVIQEQREAQAEKLRTQMEDELLELKSIRAHLHTGDFHRVRFGIGRPPGRQAASDYVLSNFPAAVRDELAFEIGRAADACEALIVKGLTAAQNEFNG